MPGTIFKLDGLRINCTLTELIKRSFINNFSFLTENFRGEYRRACGTAILHWPFRPWLDMIFNFGRMWNSGIAINVVDDWY